jgi:MOSC domain-containing protein YiiM
VHLQRVISINVGLPRIVEWAGRTVQTSIWKFPVEGPVHVAPLNLAGDEQSDLSVHGGIQKAVYVYPSEHYTYWKAALNDEGLSWGVFGENLTTEGLLEDAVRVGDRFRIGSAEFVVTKPRQPCFKLGIRFNRMEIIREFLESKRTGFYLSVLSEGEIQKGDRIEYLERNFAGPTIEEIVATRIVGQEKS